MYTRGRFGSTHGVHGEKVEVVVSLAIVTEKIVLGMCARSLVFFVPDTDALAKWSDESNANVGKKKEVL